MNDHVVRRQVDLRASPQVVWDALTDPEKTKKYFFNCGVYSDWKPGSDITFKGRMFLLIKIELSGKIIKCEPNKLLQYTLVNSGKKKSTSTVTDSISFNNGVTTLSITDDVGNGEGADERYERSVKGWDKVLKGLKKLVEERER